MFKKILNSNLALRSISAFVGVPAVLLILFSGPLYISLMLAVVFIIAVFEWFSINRQSSAKSHLVFVLGVIYIIGSGILLWQVRESPQTILWLLILVWATDTFAYFTGRSIGGPKLAPSISPGKTWSGAIGGTVCGTLISFLLIKYLNDGLLLPPAIINNQFLTLVVIMLLVVGSQAGDLLESRAKRFFGVKDSGAIIPGHGGVLDRIDSIMMTSVLYGLIVNLF